MEIFWVISIQHIYHERNIMAYRISKEGLQVGDEMWHRWDFECDTLLEHDMGPHSGLIC